MKCSALPTPWWRGSKWQADSSEKWLFVLSKVLLETWYQIIPQISNGQYFCLLMFVHFELNECWKLFPVEKTCDSPPQRHGTEKCQQMKELWDGPETIPQMVCIDSAGLNCQKKSSLLSTSFPSVSYSSQALPLFVSVCDTTVIKGKVTQNFLLNFFFFFFPLWYIIQESYYEGSKWKQVHQIREQL